MEYTIKQLADLSGVSVKTLHYYDQIHLLSPLKVLDNGYRIYGSGEVDRLQSILFYRQLDLPLKQIKALLDDPQGDRLTILENQRMALKDKLTHIHQLIATIDTTIANLKGEIPMSDQEKFQAFKEDMIKKNEEKYGQEVRDKYGDQAMDESNRKLAGMSQAQWQEAQDLSQQINDKLKMALQTGDPGSDLAQEVCDLHRQWLCMYWKEGTYSKQAHALLGETYMADPRFAAYYDQIAPGAAQFLSDALHIYCQE